MSSPRLSNPLAFDFNTGELVPRAVSFKTGPGTEPGTWEGGALAPLTFDVRDGAVAHDEKLRLHYTFTFYSDNFQTVTREHVTTNTLFRTFVHIRSESGVVIPFPMAGLQAYYAWEPNQHNVMEKVPKGGVRSTLTVDLSGMAEAGLLTGEERCVRIGISDGINAPVLVYRSLGVTGGATGSGGGGDDPPPPGPGSPPRLYVNCYGSRNEHRLNTLYDRFTVFVRMINPFDSDSKVPPSVCRFSFVPEQLSLLLPVKILHPKYISGAYPSFSISIPEMPIFQSCHVNASFIMPVGSLIPGSFAVSATWLDLAADRQVSVIYDDWVIGPEDEHADSRLMSYVGIAGTESPCHFLHGI